MVLHRGRGESSGMEALKTIARQRRRAVHGIDQGVGCTGSDRPKTVHESGITSRADLSKRQGTKEICNGRSAAAAT